MKDSAWEAVIEGATEVESLAEEFDADDRRCRTRDVLDRIIARFDCCPADDLPARAVTALVNAWLLTLDMEEQDEFWALVDENQEAASYSVEELTNA
jgi:hypothetical protein